MPTKYSPVRIKDPTSDNHVVILHPNQEFILYCTSKAKKPDIEIVSEFLYISEEKVNGSVWMFKFAQFYDLTSWSEVSRAHLGEVMVSVEKNKIVNLSLVLESKEKDIITIINPVGCVLKVSMDQTIEVVLYDNVSKDWSFVVVGGQCGLKYEKVCSELVDPAIYQVGVERPSIVLPRCLGKLKPVEDHVWFKLDKFSRDACAGLENGEYHGGKIVFSTEDEKISYNMGLLLCLKKGKGRERKPGSITEEKKIKHFPSVPVRNYTNVWTPTRKVIKLKPKQAVTLFSDSKVVAFEDFKPEDTTVVHTYGYEDMVD